MMNKISALFGSHVFSDQVMRERLPKAVYKSLKATIDKGEPLDTSIADSVAAAMKEWAMELGATHYTHWFQPLTETTAEKHDSFVSTVGDGGVILQFTGKELIKSEPLRNSYCMPAANGSDIYYQGKSSEKLPVDVKITYKLDGEEIEPSELSNL